jgi:hypothetical protein
MSMELPQHNLGDVSNITDLQEQARILESQKEDLSNYEITSSTDPKDAFPKLQLTKISWHKRLFGSSVADLSQRLANIAHIAEIAKKQFDKTPNNAYTAFKLTETLKNLVFTEVTKSPQLLGNEKISQLLGTLEQLHREAAQNPLAKIMTAMEGAIQALEKENPQIQQIIKECLPIINKTIEQSPNNAYTAFKLTETLKNLVFTEVPKSPQLLGNEKISHLLGTLEQLHREAAQNPLAKIMTAMEGAIQALEKENAPIQQIIKKYIPVINKTIEQLPKQENSVLKENVQFKALRDELVALLKKELTESKNDDERMTLDTTELRKPKENAQLLVIPTPTEQEKNNSTYSKYSQLIQKWQKAIPNIQAVRQTVSRDSLSAFQIAGKPIPQSEIESLASMCTDLNLDPKAPFSVWAQVALIAETMEKEMTEKWKNLQPKPTEKSIQDAVGDLLQTSTIDVNPVSNLAEISGMMPAAYSEPLEAFGIVQRNPSNQPEVHFVYEFSLDKDNNPICSVNTVCRYLMYDVLEDQATDESAMKKKGIDPVVDRWLPTSGKELVVAASFSRTLSSTNLTGTVNTQNYTSMLLNQLNQLKALSDQAMESELEKLDPSRRLDLYLLLPDQFSQAQDKKPLQNFENQLHRVMQSKGELTRPRAQLIVENQQNQATPNLQTLITSQSSNPQEVSERSKTEEQMSERLSLSRSIDVPTPVAQRDSRITALALSLRGTHTNTLKKRITELATERGEQDWQKDKQQLLIELQIQLDQAKEQEAGNDAIKKIELIQSILSGKTQNE